MQAYVEVVILKDKISSFVPTNLSAFRCDHNLADKLAAEDV